MPAAAQYPANNCPIRWVKCPCCPSEKGTTLPARDRGPRAVTPVDSGAPPGQACVRHSTFILKSRSLHEPLPIHMTNATRYKTERLEQPSSLAVSRKAQAHVSRPCYVWAAFDTPWDSTAPTASLHQFVVVPRFCHSQMP